MKKPLNLSKILFIDQYNKTGGGQTVLIELINSCSKLGLEITLAIPKGENYLEKNVDIKNIKYLYDYKLNNNSKKFLDYFKLTLMYFLNIKIYKKIIENDYIYINGPRYFIFAYICSLLFKKKYIYHIHLDYGKKTKRFLYHILKSNSTHKIVFTSFFVLKKFKYEIGFDEKYNQKVSVIEPCISSKYEKIDFKNRFLTNNINYNFISFGRIIPQKGFEVILEIAKEFQYYTFYIVGSPELDSLYYYQKLLNNKTKNVIFIGKTDNILNVINNFNIQFAIIPSKWEEPFGIVAIESMCFSCITIVSNKGGLIEIAQKTDANTFNSLDELKELIRNITNRTTNELNKMSFVQYTETKKKYGKKEFIIKMRGLF